MPHRSPHGRGLALVAAGGLFAASMLAGGSATASPADGTGRRATATTTTTGTAQDASTPVPVVTPDGYLMSYVVNAKVANPGQTRLVERAVVAAGGVVVQSWPQIGVVVAHSDRAAFRADVVRHGGNAVSSVGASRTAAVSEGTPADLVAVVGQGCLGLQAGPRQARQRRPVRRHDQRGSPGPGPPRGRAVGHGPDQGRPGPQDHRRRPLGPRRRARQRDRPRPPGPRRPTSTSPSSVNCTDAGRVRPDAPAPGHPTDLRPRHPRGRHHRRRPQRRRHRRCRPRTCRMASVKVVNDDGFIYPEYAICGFVWAGQHKMDVTNNSYFIDPMDVLVRRPARPGGRARTAVERAVSWSTKQGVVHAAAAGNAATDLANKTTDSDEPQRHDGGPSARSTTAASTSRPSSRASSPSPRRPAPSSSRRSATAVSASSTSRRRVAPSCRRSSPTTATAPRAAPRWRHRTSPVCSP